MTFKDELEILMKKELEIITELKDISFRKTDLIINNNVGELEEIIKREESLINNMAILEQTRERLLDMWGIANASISNVLERMPEDTTNLIKIIKAMKEIIEELGIRNELNNELINDNLDWIDFNINLMTNTHVDPGYGKGEKKTSGKSLFDRKV